MALAVDGGLVTGLLQQLGKDLLVPVKAVAVVHETVLVTVLAAHDHRAARTTYGIGTEALLKGDPVLGELVDVGCGIHRFQPSIVGTNGVRRMVIGKDKQDVRALALSFSNGLGGFGREDQRGSECNQSEESCFHEFQMCGRT